MCLPLNWIYTSLNTMQGRWNAINHWNESQCYNCWNYNVAKNHWKCREILFARNLPLFQESRREISLFWGFQTWHVWTFDPWPWKAKGVVLLSRSNSMCTKFKGPSWYRLQFSLYTVYKLCAQTQRQTDRHPDRRLCHTIIRPYKSGL